VLGDYRRVLGHGEVLIIVGDVPLDRVFADATGQHELRSQAAIGAYCFYCCCSERHLVGNCCCSKFDRAKIGKKFPINQENCELFLGNYSHYLLIMHQPIDVKALREKVNLTQHELAEKTGIPRERIAKWEQKKGSPKSEDYIKLMEVLREDIPKGYTEERRAKKLSQKKNTVPFYDAEATATITETEMSPIHAPAGTIDVGDLLHDSQAAIRIYGNSMTPHYPPGCVVGLQRCSTHFIEPGEVYVIETRDKRLLKRLFYKDDDTNSDFITCYSDNTMKFESGARNGKLAYPPFDIPKSDIITLFNVTGVIKRNTNSIIMNRGLTK